MQLLGGAGYDYKTGQTALTDPFGGGAIADEALIGINIVAGAVTYNPMVQLIFKRK